MSFIFAYGTKSGNCMWLNNSKCVHIFLHWNELDRRWVEVAQEGVQEAAGLVLRATAAALRLAVRTLTEAAILVRVKNLRPTLEKGRPIPRRQKVSYLERLPVNTKQRATRSPEPST